jgi:hypothetical protein
MALLDLPVVSPRDAHIFLWRRIPHSDTLVPGGPEIDFGILTENAVILGEAKWQSGTGTRQGKRKDKDQIQLRGEFLKTYGKRLFPFASIWADVGLSLLPDAFTNTVPDGPLGGGLFSRIPPQRRGGEPALDLEKGTYERDSSCFPGRIT